MKEPQTIEQLEQALKRIGVRVGALWKSKEFRAWKIGVFNSPLTAETYEDALREAWNAYKP